MIIKKILNKILSKPLPTGSEVPIPIPEDKIGGSMLTTNSKTLDRPLVVIDVGCRWGFAERFMQDADKFRVYGFDPDREECERLTKIYGHKAPITLVPLGLAGTSGLRTLYITSEPACSSLLPPDPELTASYPSLYCARQEREIQVETTTLDLWVEGTDISAVDYIKVDTQGTELEILQGGSNTLEKVRSLEVEVEFNPIYQGQPLFSDVDLFLRKKGFVLWKLTNQVHYSRGAAARAPLGEDTIFYDDKYRISHLMYGGQLYWGNAHYIHKTVLRPDLVSESQRARDVALFNVLGMNDVVQHIYSFQENID
ncbi:FkbM family methyltransferase [Pollutimonas bauzanensis]|uniref:Methyltransferase, FkbM family n=1 Tax=Pollutimonas bauzanensis TaxID=658167 RepID=A0A1M6BKJ4_9BURK|nr:FkbM family methyltransferase [Pollutimonas bauzanensis]SHI49196.1 methyltransferase, FkbM family [Pollutimonas bauzanensis]